MERTVQELSFLLSIYLPKGQDRRHEWLLWILEETHLSDLAILTLHGFHSACSIHAFPPTQPPTAGRETQTRWLEREGAVAPKDRDKESNSTCLLVVCLSGQVSAAVRFMEESDFHDVG